MVIGMSLDSLTNYRPNLRQNHFELLLLGLKSFRLPTCTCAMFSSGANAREKGLVILIYRNLHPGQQLGKR